MKLTQRTTAALVATVLFAPALLMGAQQDGPSGQKDEAIVPRTELFLGYSYIRAVPTLADGNRFVWLNGGSTSLAYNVTHSLGLVTDFGGYNDTQLRLTGPGANPVGIVGASGASYTFLFGPRLSLRNYRRITPFAQVLAGGAYATAVTLDTCSIAPCVPLPEQGSFAMTAGGGLDINLSRRISFRAIQAEYLMTRFANTTTSVRSIQNDMRLSSGLVFRFGGHAASPLPVPVNHAPVAICSANPTTVHVNWEHPVMLQAQAVDTDGDRLSYMWSVSAGTLANPSSPSTEWHIDDLSPGAYKATLHVDDGHGGVADCSVNLNVEVPPAHPSLTCSAGSSTVYAGDTVTLNVQATNVDPKTLVWSPTSGQIDTSSAQARLITSKGVIGKYTMTAHAQSPSGEEASCQVVVDTQLPIAIVEVEKRLALHSIYFPTAKPTVEHLERGLLQSQRDTLASLAADFLAYREYVPNAKLVLEGHADPRGSDEYNEHLSERRVDASKRFLVGKGVSETSIEVKALGDRHDLTDAEVRDAVDHNDELTPAERATLHKNMKTIILASNRRVDITLTPTGQHSTRTFPFNAKDAIILISQREPHTRKAVK